MSEACFSMPNTKHRPDMPPPTTNGQHCDRRLSKIQSLNAQGSLSGCIYARYEPIARFICPYSSLCPETEGLLSRHGAILLEGLCYCIEATVRCHHVFNLYDCRAPPLFETLLQSLLSDAYSEHFLDIDCQRGKGIMQSWSSG